jgi:putative membrane protein
MDNDKLTISDYLAIERTNLANERTLLAYLRTFIILISSGFAIIKLDFLKEINILGIILLSIAPLIFLTGVFRFYSMKKRIKKHYQYKQ